MSTVKTMTGGGNNLHRDNAEDCLLKDAEFYSPLSEENTTGSCIREANVDHDTLEVLGFYFSLLFLLAALDDRRAVYVMHGKSGFTPAWPKE